MTEDRPRRGVPLNPPGFLATQDLKERGWTPTLILKFLGEHDATRPNGLKMGRRKLPPVKLYREERVNEVEREDAFLAAQARAADARERAEHRRAEKAARRAAQLRAAAESYVPVIYPEPLRKGSVRKARDPYLPTLAAVQAELTGELGQVTEAEAATLAELLRGRLDAALSLVYPWYLSPDAKKTPTPRSAEAKSSDWREWEWD
ncbi:hypothetical protein [Deinococcus sp. Leaf326]|jgi:hypothetical protein|uniref:hypothetical protein n=1 Tax=Deinococcus sp. Leaf326 TaxID=1736338 RepID=UPI0006FFEC22|nr:hypothetical protein [Deinococcus sp. Leaf326]KQR41053.1 hypothetical protein ASF71_02685 [Deinococcus sp. Leaf326]